MDPQRRRLLALIGCAAIRPYGTAESMGRDAFDARHKQMLEEIARDAQETQHETGRARFSDRVMAALAQVPRHRFVPPEEEKRAYLNRPLPIGSGQTISQPFIVALMTDFLEIRPGDKVLEIGTGSGYQAAVLAELAGTVYTIEIIDSLGKEAAKRLEALGYRNVVTRIGDGYEGWPEAAPFDAIMVTAAARRLPQALVDQLSPGGRLVIPIENWSGGQTLQLIEKAVGGEIRRRDILAVRFVPLTGKAQQ